MKKPEPKTVEDAKEVVQDAEQIVRTIKHRIKGANAVSGKNTTKPDLLLGLIS